MKRWLAALAVLAIALGAWIYGGRANLEVRDRALAPEPQSRPILIGALGTSLTANATWPAALEEALDACAPYDVSVLNMALAGANSNWGVTQAGPLVAVAPDILLIEFSINDADITDGVWLSQSRENHAAILKALPEQTRPVLMSMSPAHGLPGLIRPRLASYYDAYQDLAARHQTGLIDFYARWRQLPKPQQRFADGLHPDAQKQNAVMLAPLTAYIGALIGVPDCAP
jgi:lysophospholipase L1-like esterase